MTVVEILSQLIGTMGFPIGCCIFMFWKEARFTEHMEQTLEEIKRTVDNNSRIVERILNKEDEI
jgi:hypothetical protein